jgi:hypothetical protein
MIVVLCMLGSGCGVVRHVTQTAIIDQIQYNESTNQFFTDIRNKRLADSAWREFRKQNVDKEYSSNFARGFRSSFVDYLEGGTGEAPVVPPRRYWKVHYQTPEGHMAVSDWFTGWRFGTTVADQSDLRHWVKVPTTLPDDFIGTDFSVTEQNAPLLVTSHESTLWDQLDDSVSTEATGDNVREALLILPVTSEATSEGGGDIPVTIEADG